MTGESACSSLLLLTYSLTCSLAHTQACGKPTADDLASHRLLTSLTLLEPMDTLLVLDRWSEASCDIHIHTCICICIDILLTHRRVKHEACPIAPAEDAMGVAVRDVLTFEVRPRPHLAPEDTGLRGRE